MLAKNVNANACFLDKRGACEVFASKLAPTEGPVPASRDAGIFYFTCSAPSLNCNAANRAYSGLLAINC
ncbi:hypothetical protein DXU77_12865 [Pseudomonas lactis]|nr:hypothetical protein [Pseudomonas lactis]